MTAPNEVSLGRAQRALDGARAQPIEQGSQGHTGRNEHASQRTFPIPMMNHNSTTSHAPWGESVFCDDEIVQLCEGGTEQACELRPRPPHEGTVESQQHARCVLLLPERHPLRRGNP